MTDEEPTNDLLTEGIRLFNQAHFFECHEVLEKLWMQQVDPERQFTQGLIQIAVGFHHARNGNTVGAIKLLTRGSQRVQPFLPQHHGIALSQFLSQINECLAILNTADASIQQLQRPFPVLDRQPTIE